VLVSTDRPAKRREIENSTAARLAEIVAAAEQAAKQVIDQAEEEARTRLDDAHDEADRIVAERLAGLARLTDEIAVQSEALRRGAEALQQALAQAQAELGGAEAPAGSATIGHREAEQASRGPTSPSLTVVGGAPADERAPSEPVADPGSSPQEPAPTGRRAEGTARQEPPAVAKAAVPDPDFDSEPPSIGHTHAGARLLATQMAVSGSSRAEIESRLRHGFEIADTRAILDAILGPEQ
jgi:vacuolar-type H+-ATPase subunit H